MTEPIADSGLKDFGEVWNALTIEINRMGIKKATEILRSQNTLEAYRHGEEADRDSLWVVRAKDYVAECFYPEYVFDVIISETTKAVYLQGHYYEKDTLDPRKIEKQYTRRWFLSPEMSKSEVVSTVFKCVLTSMEHRAREWFLHNGKAIYQPHYDVDALAAICEQRQQRPEPARA